MSEELRDDKPRQFSLRTLLVATTVCAVVAGATKLLGASIGSWLVTIAAITAGVLAAGRATRIALLQSCVVVYGPFVAMASYTALFVDCSHCKTTSWEILPMGPGLISLELAHHFLDAPRLDGAVSFAASVVVALGAIAALTAGVRATSHWPSLAILILAASYFSFCAWGLLALLRA